MSGSFTVQTAGLQSAAVAVAASGTEVQGSYGTFSTVAGALDGTPVQFAYADFLSAAERAMQSLHTASQGLSQALNAAAYAYQAADGTIADRMTAHK